MPDLTMLPIGYHSPMESLMDRFKKARKEAGLTQEKLADKSGVSQTTIHKIEIGTSHTSKFLPVLAKTLGVSLEWLVYGSEGMSLSPPKMQLATRNLAPLVTPDQILGGILGPESKGIEDITEWYHVTNSMGPKTFTYRVQGDIMTSQFAGARSYPHDSVLYVDPDAERKTGPIRVLAIYRGAVTFREYVEDGHSKYLKPLNSQYPITEVDSDLQILGVVVATFISE